MYVQFFNISITHVSNKSPLFNILGNNCYVFINEQFTNVFKFQQIENKNLSLFLMIEKN